MIPNQVHFVFGLQEQHEPFSFVHYLAIESCRRVVNPTTIFFHHLHVPYGPWWDRIAPHLQMVKVERNPAVDAADYSGGNVPSAYRYAHHADFVRLDALIEFGGIYADIDTVFVRPIRADLFRAPFVIGRESPVRDERTGIVKPSLCNALMMAEPHSRFASVWRERMPEALNGTWSNHSGFLAKAIAEEMPDEVHVEAQETFFPFAASSEGFREPSSSVTNFQLAQRVCTCGRICGGGAHVRISASPTSGGVSPPRSAVHARRSLTSPVRMSLRADLPARTPAPSARTRRHGGSTAHSTK